MASRLGRGALVALAACGGPNCPPESREGPSVTVIHLEDGGTEVVHLPVAIYGTAPPPCH